MLIHPQIALFFLLPFLLLTFFLAIPTRGQNVTIVGNSFLARPKRQYVNRPDDGGGGHYMSDWVKEPPILELTHNLTLINGPTGRYGVCARTYRVLEDLKNRPNMECQRYANSRQAALGDLTEFYHTLYHSRKQKETITFMLSDSFPEFAFSASFIASNPGAPPFLMIEAAKSAKQALCVQSHRCPEPTTTTTTTTTTTSTTTIPPRSIPLLSLHPAASQQSGEKSDPKKPPNFWEAIMANSSPRIWVVSTLVLACVSIILFITLICTCFWLCRTKRSYRRKRCRGTCRFGCKCTPDTIRQAAADAAVCGPIGAQTNGSVLTYPSVGRSWGLTNSTKAPLNQLYVSLGTNEKLMGTQSSGTPPSQQMFPPGQPLLGDNWPHQMAFQKSLVTKDAMWRSHSDGSSLSDHTVPSGVGSGPSAIRNQPSRSSGQPAGAYAFNANPSSATASTCMQSYGGGVSGQGDSGPTDGHPGSPMRFEDGQNNGQNGFDHNGITAQPVELRGINGGLYDQSVGDMGDTFAQHSELTSITPPAGFYDVNGKPTNNSKLDQSWTYGGHLQQSSFAPSSNPSNLSGAVKVLPNDILLGGKQVSGNSPADYKRRNGFLNGGDCSIEDTSMRRPGGGLTSHILSHPLTEGVEQSYSYEGNNDTPLRAWTDALSH